MMLWRVGCRSMAQEQVREGALRVGDPAAGGARIWSMVARSGRFGMRYRSSPSGAAW
jgi:hypothetical protein